MLEQHRDTQDELKIKKQMAQFMANAVTQVNMHCQEMTDKKVLNNFLVQKTSSFYNKT